jgi:cellulose synthase/poly-beta-1,6-N-acetylglucosamine synthase-like glycosyltransferase
MELALTLLLYCTYLVGLYFSIFWILAAFDKPVKQEAVHGHRRISSCPGVSIIIPTFNGEAGIGSSIESVLNLDYPADKLELVVVNDGSTDRTERIVSEIISHNPTRNIRLVTQKNQGKAAALNTGIGCSVGEFFACMDDDSLVDKDALKRMVQAFLDYGDGLAVVTPAMKVFKPGNLLQRLQSLEYVSSIMVNRILSGFDSVYVAPGPFSLYNRKIMKHVGEFDTDSIAEDQEIAYRIQKFNYAIKQCPDAFVYTVSPANIRALYRQRNRWYKGGYANLIKYKRLAFNREYGHFGFFQLPMNIIFLPLGILSIFFFVYLVILPVLRRVNELYLVGFDIWPYLKNLKFSFDFLGINYPQLIILSSLLVCGLGLLLLSFRSSREALKKRHLVDFVPYLFVYYLLLGLISVVAFVELAVGRRQKW